MSIAVITLPPVTSLRLVARASALAWLAVLALFVGSATPAPRARANVGAAPAVDSLVVHSPDTAAAWAYRRTEDVDLDGDEIEDRLVLVADVVLSESGAPLWEDGHRWAAYVETAGAARTLLYSAFLPNGSVEAALLGADSSGRRAVVVLERTPYWLRHLELEYLAPGATRVRSATHHEVERWLAEPPP